MQGDVGTNVMQGGAGTNVMQGDVGTNVMQGDVTGKFGILRLWSYDPRNLKP